jgi:pimeloyl-ACP methyl ester carboxylesterase
MSSREKEDSMSWLQMQCKWIRSTALLAATVAIGCGADQLQEAADARPTQVSSIRDIKDARIRTIDHRVHHISTVDANYGEHVKLFVREKVRRDLEIDDHSDGDDDSERSGNRKGRLPVVLMIAGATSAAMAIYDVPFENYSWMTYLAESGFDVFAMDLTGYGLSPRPKMDDACNASEDQQKLLLIPNPLSAACQPSYAKKMAIQSDWDEMDTVIDYLRKFRGVERVSLIGWSRGGPRIGGYVARHGEKVEKLVLYSPAAYDPTRTSEPPRDPNTGRLIPEPGVLMQVQTVAGFFGTWNGQLRCENQFTPGIRPVLASSLLESDQLGSTWGPEGLWRAPAQNTLWGWNATDAGKIAAPTLIIRGLHDTQAPEPPQRLLFADLKAAQKVFVRVACAGHQLMFENQHMILLQASAEWLRDGSFDRNKRYKSGSFDVKSLDAQGNYLYLN